MLVFRAQLTKNYSLLGYGFQPRLINSLAHVTAGSVMIIGLSIKEFSHWEKKCANTKEDGHED